MLMKEKDFMKSAGRRGYSPLARVLTAIVMMFTLATTGAWADETYPIVYDFEAAANAGENPSNKNGSSANGQQFYGWESEGKTDWPRQDYKGYEWAEGSKLPEVCHVWRRSDRINGNVAGNGGLKCPSDKQMAVDGLTEGLTVTIIYDATNASSKEIVWAIGDGSSSLLTQPRATATINGVEAVPGQTTIKSGDVITVTKVTPAANGSGYIVFKVMKDMVIKKIIIDEAKAEPSTFTVSLKEGTEDAENWTIEPEEATTTGVDKDTKITATYSGSRHVKSVTAVTKAAVTYPMVSEATASDYGKVVCAAGHLHDAKTAVPTGCTAVAIFAYIDGGNNRIAIALQDGEAATWYTLTTDGANNNTLCSVPGTWTVTAPTDAEWFVGTKAIYEAIFTNLGSTTGDSDGKTYDDNVNAYITTVGGKALSGGYWSTSEKSESIGWDFGSGCWYNDYKTSGLKLRPVLVW